MFSGSHCQSAPYIEDKGCHAATWSFPKRACLLQKAMEDRSVLGQPVLGKMEKGVHDHPSKPAKMVGEKTQLRGRRYRNG